MQYVYRFILNTDVSTKNALVEMCSVSKCLYNQALYEIKQTLEKENKFLFYQDLDKIMKTKTNLDGNINYRLLKAQVSQQNLKTLDKSIKSYFNALKEYKAHPEKFTGKPQLPNWNKGKYRQLIFTNQSAVIKNGNIFVSKTIKFSIPQYDRYKDLISNFNQIRILPKRKGTVLECEIVYEIPETHFNLDYERHASIDFGVDNLVTLVNDYSNPVIYSGKQIKSINQYFNKRLTKLNSSLKKCQDTYTSKQKTNLYEKRERRINDILHKVSKHIVDELVKHNVGNLVVGYNSGWKDSINLGNKTNQTFVQIPYAKLVQYLKYKCESCGIYFIKNEESYTSKCDSIVLEKIGKHEKYSGKRIKRGLFQSASNKLINADVNGAMNIMRKVVGDSYASKIINSGRLFLPIKFNNLYDLKTL